jgi:hypothetical protein
VTANVPLSAICLLRRLWGLTQLQKTILNELCGELSGVIGTVAGSASVPVVDLYAQSANAASIDPADSSQDGFHPSDQGYAKLADVFWPMLRPQLNRKPVANAQTLSTPVDQDLEGTLTAGDDDLDEGNFTFAKPQIRQMAV